MTGAMRALSLALLAGLLSSAAAQPRPQPLTVYGASDLAFAFAEIVPLFEKAMGARVTLVLGSTGNLAKQIEHGAPADIFFAADEGFVEDLRAKGAVVAETRALYAQGRIVLAVPAAATVSDLRELARPEIKRIAIASPGHAPYGRAAREALEATGLWEGLRAKLVYADNVRHALQFLQAGAVEAAIVARSIADVAQIRYVVIDPGLHRPLNQVAAVVRRSPRPELALAFLHFVNGPEGRRIMKRYGFLLPGEF